MKRLALFTLIVAVLLVLFSCKQDKTVGTQQIESDFELVRFDELFSKADKQDIQDLRDRYTYLFPGEYTDDYWLGYKNDSIYQMLSQEVSKAFKDFSKEQKAISDIFGEVKEHYPTFKPPKVMTLISSVDVNNQVIYADSLMLVSLDTYLGKDSPLYVDFEPHIRAFLDKKQLPIDVATAVVKKTYSLHPDPVFVERLVDAGKSKYAVQQLLPLYSEAQIMNYSDKKYQWAKDNEYHIWQYFMEKKYVYSSEKDLMRRFLEPAPFSKFYIESDAESPGQIGVWIGWQIVKQYADKHKDESLPELLAKPSMEIFKASNYKPRR